ncbi:MAG: Smr/MutS family protein [Sandaracinaceae bacterium]|nr:Smr/MutS family protein [Sandaracinaceae bacterium]
MARETKKDVGTSLRDLLAGVSPAPPREAAKREPAKAPPAKPAKAPPAKAPEASRPSEGLRGDDRVRFMDAMVGVRPLAARTVAKRVARPASAQIEAARVRGSGADEEARARLAALVAGAIRFCVEREDDRVRGWRADGAERAARELERRGVVPEATLDLHGMRAAEAERALVRFVRHQHRRGVRRVCVIHGKGLHSEGGAGVLADRVIHALTEGGAAPVVTAFATAPQELGGAGALLVQLVR